LTVDDHVAHARSELVRLGVGREITHGSRIKDSDIGMGAGAQHAAINQPKVGCRQTREATDRFGQIDQTLVADVVAEKASKSAVRPRMR
jgi:hypothetical protein